MPQITPGADNRTANHILLFGMPRSGTTWLGKLFDSHPDTLYRHEPDTSKRLVMPRYPLVEDAHQYAEIIQNFVAGLPRVNTLRVAGKSPLFPKTYLSPGRFQALRGNAWLARLGGQFNLDIPIVMSGGQRSHAQRPRVVWKSIESLGRIGVILEALPHARAIHILRHPCGYIASVLRGQNMKRFTDNTPVSEDYGIFTAVLDTPLGRSYNLTRAALEALTSEERLAWRWVLLNEKAVMESEATGRVLCIRYEDICIDPVGQIEQMYRFSDLGMSEQTRRFAASSTAHTNNRYYSVYKNPEVAAMRWREELPADVVDRVMAIVRRSRFADCFAVDSIERPVTS